MFALPSDFCGTLIPCSFAHPKRNPKSKNRPYSSADTSSLFTDCAAKYVSCISKITAYIARFVY